MAALPCNDASTICSAYPDSLLDALALRSYAHDAGQVTLNASLAHWLCTPCCGPARQCHVTVMASPVRYVQACHTLYCTHVT